MKTLIKQYRKLIIIFALPYLFIVVASLIHVEYDVTAPGQLNEVREVISVEGSTKEFGTFNTVSVFTSDRTTLLTYLISLLNPKMSLDESPEYIHLSNKESYRSGTIQKNVSITNALIAAYRAAGKEITTKYHGLIIHTTHVDVAEGFLIGDIICEWEGTTIDKASTLTEIISKLTFSKGKSYQVTVLREKSSNKYEKQVIEVTPKRARTDGTPFLGLYLYDYYSIIETNPSYTLRKASTLGPSGGLIQALSIYNAITDTDITFGLKIAGTGTIDSLGNVGEIGGVRQKIITANLAKADVFFVPVVRSNGAIDLDKSSNYVEAKAAYDALRSPKMQLVPVATLQEAIDWLINYGKTV